MRHTAAILLVLTTAVGGCGRDGDRAQVREAVEGFYAAVRSGDGTAACRELSDALVEQLEGQTRQACDDVVTRLEYDGGAPVRTEVVDESAEVELSTGERAFLSRESDGWKLSAIGCSPEPGDPREVPMDCEAQA